MEFLAVITGLALLMLAAFVALSCLERLEQVITRRRARSSDAATQPPVRDVDDEYQRARRAMNDAAGQSWRNLID